jgi:cyclomaltodextrinase / maltogenic alpha-amylase / neopullulanase
MIALIRPMRIGAVCAALWTCLAWTQAAAEAPLAFATEGGEAWTFHKRIELLAGAAICNEITVSSPRGAVTTRPFAGRAVVDVPLASGSNELGADCRSDGVSRYHIAGQHWFVRLRDAPTARVSIHVTDKDVTLDARASERAPGTPAAITRYEWRERAGNPSSLPLPVQGAIVNLTRPVVDGEYYLILRVTDATGRLDESTVSFHVHKGQITQPDVLRDHPAWVEQAVIYGVMPKAFASGNLAGVIERLDALARLGIRVIWLSPVTSSPPGDFGYAVTDHFKIQGALGNYADLQRLIKAAHTRGMRVILDSVPNHFSDQHAYFIDAEQRGRKSAYYDFFSRAAGDKPLNYFNWQNLKNLNYDNPEVRRLMIEAFAYWIREFDVDGFRVDVAWGPRQRAPDFWPIWRRELKRIKPDIFLLAEASGRDPYYARNGFDAAYDWTDKLGEWAWQAAFEDETNTASRLRTAIRASAADPETLVFRFLNNNDTGVRFITRYGLERTRVATAMLFLLPGLPALYTGDEVGATFEPYKTTTPIDWVDSHDLAAWHTRLITLRRETPALRSQELVLLDASHAERVLVFERPGATPEQTVLVLLNFSEDPLNVELRPGTSGLFAPGTGSSETVQLMDMLDRENVMTSGAHPQFRLAPYGVRILQAH